MRTNALNALERLKSTWRDFTPGQRVVAIVGSAAVLLAAFFVFSWSNKPEYAPLYSGISSEDASAIVDKLAADGTPYELSNGGTTIMVPKDVVYDTRIAMSGEGLPGNSDSGYSILDDQGLSTSEFQQQTDFKRAMEGELANTIEAIDGVDTAVVHLAIPQKEVFTDSQDPTTASVLIDTSAGESLNANAVQSIVNLVSSSVDGLKPENISITDANGNVLHAPGAAESAAQTQDQAVIDFQNRLTSEIQGNLDRVLGPGNSTVTINPVLNFDKSTEQTTRYFGDPVTLSEATNEEILNGNGTGETGRGILGPQGQMETDINGTDGNGDYSSNQASRDYGNNVVVSNTEAAPGQVKSLHVGVMIDQAALQGRDVGGIQDSIASALGIDEARGDTISVTPVAFDTTAKDAAAAELAAAKKADDQKALFTLIRNIAIAALFGLALLLAWLQARRKARARAAATEYIVEQLRAEQIERANAAELERPQGHGLEGLEAPNMPALEGKGQADEWRDEIGALVDRQPDEVADLLRGWLVR